MTKILHVLIIRKEILSLNIEKLGISGCGILKEKYSRSWLSACQALCFPSLIVQLTCGPWDCYLPATIHHNCRQFCHLATPAELAWLQLPASRPSIPASRKLPEGAPKDLVSEESLQKLKVRLYIMIHGFNCQMPTRSGLMPRPVHVLSRPLQPQTLSSQGIRLCQSPTHIWFWLQHLNCSHGCHANRTSVFEPLELSDSDVITNIGSFEE